MLILFGHVENAALNPPGVLFLPGGNGALEANTLQFTHTKLVALGQQSR